MNFVLMKWSPRGSFTVGVKCTWPRNIYGDSNFRDRN